MDLNLSPALMSYLVLITSLISTGHSATTNVEAQLISDLFTNHSVDVRPVLNSSHPVVVDIIFMPISTREVNEQDQFMKIYGIFAITYNDAFLTWNPSSYAGLQLLTIDPAKLWKPTIGVYNSMQAFFDERHNAGMRCLLTPDGNIVWMLGGEFGFTCDMNTVNFPFDYHVCTLKIASWCETQHLIRLFSSYSPLPMDLYEENGLWELTSTTAEATTITAEIAPLVFDAIEFKFTIKRKLRYEFLNKIVPLILTILLLPTMFLLPCDSGERISVGITVLLTLSVYQLAINESTPATSDHTPLLTFFLTSQMGISVFSVMATTFVLRFHHSTSKTRPPRWLRIAIFKYLALAVCMPNKHREHKEDQVSDFHQEGKSSSAVEEKSHSIDVLEEWKSMGEVLDRFFFYLFSVIIASSTLGFIVTPAISIS